MLPNGNIIAHDLVFSKYFTDREYRAKIGATLNLRSDLVCAKNLGREEMKKELAKFAGVTGSIPFRLL